MVCYICIKKGYHPWPLNMWANCITHYFTLVMIIYSGDIFAFKKGYHSWPLNMLVIKQVSKWANCVEYTHFFTLTIILYSDNIFALKKKIFNYNEVKILIHTLYRKMFFLQYVFLCCCCCFLLFFLSRIKWKCRSFNQ